MKFFHLNKLKTPLLVGAMLLGVVACSDYDDDIAGLSNRLDNIESSYVTISSVESQIAAVSASIPDLTSVYSRLTAIEGELEGIDLGALSSTVTGLSTTVGTLSSTIEGLSTTIKTNVETIVTEDFLTEMLDNVYLTEVTLAQIQAVLTADALTAILGDAYVTEIPAVTLAEIEALVGDENGGLIADIVDAMAEASGWISADMSQYLLIDNYSAYTDDQATAAAKAYFETIEETLVADLAGQTLTTEVTLSSGAVTTIEAALEELNSRVAEIEGRIQSIVFVPETANTFAVTFAGKDYVTFGEGDDATNVYLTSATTSQELTFRVSPASWAEKFTTENVSLYSEKYTRAEAPFSIESITASTEEAGKFTVALKYNLDEAAIYGYGIALHVAIDATSEGATAGIDYTTDYVNVNVEAGEEMSESIVYGGTYDGEFVTIASISGNTNEYAVKQYDYTETVTFFDGCGWYVLGGETPVAFSSLYSSDILSVEAPEDAATLSDDTNAKAYALTATSATIIDSKSALIGDVITSGDYTFALVSGEESISLGTATSTLEIAKLTQTFFTTSWTVNYLYGTSIYISETDIDSYIVIDQTQNAMSAEFFNTVRSIATNADSCADYTNRSLKIYESDKETEVSSSLFFAYLFLPSEVASSSDAQPVRLTLYNVSADDAGEYVAIYTLNDVEGDEVVIEIPFTIVGMPEFTSLPAFTSVKDFTGQTSDEISEDIYAALWAANEAALEDHITEEEFIALLKASTVVATQEDATTLSIDGDGAATVAYNFEELVFGETYTMTYTLSNSTFGDDFTTITVNATLNNNLSGTIQAANAYLDANGNIEIETAFVNGIFDVVDKDLKSTHSLITTLDGEVTMVYSIAEDLEAWAEANPGLIAPAVVEGVLEWNDWDSTEIQMVVEAELAGVAVDSNEFTAYIVNPLADAITTTALNLYIDDLDGTVDLNSAISLLESKSGVKDSNIFPTYQLAFGTAPSFEYVGTSDATTAMLVELNGDVVSFSDAAESSAVMKNAVTYTYKVTYETFYFGDYEANITVKVNEAGVSVN